MNRAGEVAYHAVALVAILAHVFVVGPLSLLALYLIAPAGTELIALVLKLLVAATWCGLGLLGVRAWRRRTWAVAAVPLVSFSVVWVLIFVGNETIGWWLVGR